MVAQGALTRGARVASALAIASAIAAASLGQPGCGGDDAVANAPADAASDVVAPADVSSPDAASDGAHPDLPYPPGPYSPAVGGVMPDFSVEGYALSREQRDSRYLPWRDVTASDVRSWNPSCTCMAILVNAVGTACPPCLFEDQTLAAAIAPDPTLCAIEAALLNFDGFTRGDGGTADETLPTRADVDAFTEALRQDYPVGIVTESAAAALSTPLVDAFPYAYVARTSDMRVAGMVLGSGKDLGPVLHALCDAPRAGPEVLAGGLAARALVTDGQAAWLSDERLGVVRVATLAPAPSAVRVVARPASTPDALALDADHVYWATHDGGPAFEVGRVDKAPAADGGAASPEVLATSTSGFTGIAVDATYVYFTRTDGVVGRVPLAGGAEEALFTGEDAPGAIAVDEASVYWVASAGHDVVRGAKSGGGRASLIEPGVLPPSVVYGELAIDGDLVLAYSELPSAGAWALLGLKKVAAPFVDLGLGGPGKGTFAIAPDGSVASGARDDARGLGKIAVRPPPSRQDGPAPLTFGQPGVTAVAVDADDVLWFDAVDGTLRRMKR